MGPTSGAWWSRVCSFGCGRPAASRRTPAPTRIHEQVSPVRVGSTEHAASTSSTRSAVRVDLGMCCTTCPTDAPARTRPSVVVWPRCAQARPTTTAFRRTPNDASPTRPAPRAHHGLHVHNPAASIRTHPLGRRALQVSGQPAMGSDPDLCSAGGRDGRPATKEPRRVRKSKAPSCGRVERRRHTTSGVCCAPRWRMLSTRV